MFSNKTQLFPIVTHRKIKTVVASGKQGNEF